MSMPLHSQPSLFYTLNSKHTTTKDKALHVHLLTTECLLKDVNIVCGVARDCQDVGFVILWFQFMAFHFI